MARPGTAKKSTNRKKTSKAKRKTKKMPKRKTAKKKATKKKKKLTSKKKTKSVKKKVKTKRATKKATKKKTKKSPTRKTGSKTTKTRAKLVQLTTPDTGLVAGEVATIEKVRVGDLAPDFTLMDQKGTSVSLSQFRGKKVVLYFYPKDDTPGCTKEACSFRDHLAQFQGLNAEIVGVSFDDQPSHQKFIEKYGLNFTLLSDTNKEVADSYGVHVQKNMYGKTYWGIQRSTFVIDTEGRVSQIFRNVKVDGHTEEVISALEQAV